MPTGSLPKEGKALWEKVYEHSKSDDCDEGCAARKAWSAVESAGWKKDKEGKWHKKSLAEFSLRITKASLDEDGRMCWMAVTSDTEDDLAQDNMTQELFDDFIERIEKEEKVPEVFRSDFWSGGMPYLSISHYPDLDGSGVPGSVEVLYRDGKYLKAKGYFHDNPLGKACWTSLKEDKNREIDERVRISIGFLDYMHKHKSTGEIFERKEIDDMCPECVIELIKDNGEGKEFLRGQLVHLAMTRVPMNERTRMDMEEKSMTTRKEDAESIVGEELAEELENKAVEPISKALVTKTDEEEDKLEAKIDALADGIEQLMSAVGKLAELQVERMKDKDKEKEDEEEDMEDEEEDKEEKKSDFDPVIKSLSEMSVHLGQKLDILIAQTKAPVAPDNVVRRSVQPTPDMVQPAAKRDPSKPMSPAEYARAWAGLK